MNKLHLSHARFSILFSALLYVVCNAINIGALAKWFQVRDGLNYWALAAYLVAGLCLLIVFVTDEDDCSHPENHPLFTNRSERCGEDIDWSVNMRPDGWRAPPLV